MTRAERLGAFLGHVIVSVSAGIIVVALADAPSWAGTMITMVVWFCTPYVTSRRSQR